MSYPHRTARPSSLLARLALAVVLAGGAAAQAWAQAPRLDVPFVPTPQAVVDRMLELAKVKPDGRGSR